MMGSRVMKESLLCEAGCRELITQVLAMKNFKATSVIASGFFEVNNTQAIPVVLGVSDDSLVIVREVTEYHVAVCEFEIWRLSGTTFELGCIHSRTLNLKNADGQNFEFRIASGMPNDTWHLWSNKIYFSLPCQSAQKAEQAITRGMFKLICVNQNPFREIQKLTEMKDELEEKRRKDESGYLEQRRSLDSTSIKGSTVSLKDETPLSIAPEDQYLAGHSIKDSMAKEKLETSVDQIQRDEGKRKALPGSIQDMPSADAKFPAPAAKEEAAEKTATTRSLSIPRSIAEYKALRDISPETKEADTTAKYDKKDITGEGRESVASRGTIAPDELLTAEEFEDFESYVQQLKRESLSESISEQDMRRYFREPDAASGERRKERTSLESETGTDRDLPPIARDFWKYETKKGLPKEVIEKRKSTLSTDVEDDRSKHVDFPGYDFEDVGLGAGWDKRESWESGLTAPPDMIHKATIPERLKDEDDYYREEDKKRDRRKSKSAIHYVSSNPEIHDFKTEDVFPEKRQERRESVQSRLRGDRELPSTWKATGMQDYGTEEVIPEQKRRKSFKPRPGEARDFPSATTAPQRFEIEDGRLREEFDKRKSRTSMVAFRDDLPEAPRIQGYDVPEKVREKRISLISRPSVEQSMPRKTKIPEKYVIQDVYPDRVASETSIRIEQLKETSPQDYGIPERKRKSMTLIPERDTILETGHSTIREARDDLLEDATKKRYPGLSRYATREKSMPEKSELPMKHVLDVDEYEPEIPSARSSAADTLSTSSLAEATIDSRRPVAKDYRTKAEKDELVKPEPGKEKLMAFKDVPSGAEKITSTKTPEPKAEERKRQDVDKKEIPSELSEMSKGPKSNWRQRVRCMLNARDRFLAVKEEAAAKKAKKPAAAEQEPTTSESGSSYDAYPSDIQLWMLEDEEYKEEFQRILASPPPSSRARRLIRSPAGLSALDEEDPFSLNTFDKRVNSYMMKKSKGSNKLLDMIAAERTKEKPSPEQSYLFQWTFTDTLSKSGKVEQPKQERVKIPEQPIRQSKVVEKKLPETEEPEQILDTVPESEAYLNPDLLDTARRLSRNRRQSILDDIIA